MRTILCWLTALLLALELPAADGTKSYSSGGGRSYSSSSSRSSSSGGSRSSSGSSYRSSSSGSSSSRSSSSGSTRSTGSSGSKSFSSGSGKSYSSGSTGSDSERRGYSSGKSYSAGAGRSTTSSPGKDSASRLTDPARNTDPNGSKFTFDNAAARARKEEASKTEFSRFKDSQPGSSTYAAKPPPLSSGGGNGSYRSTRYVPDAYTISSRPVRIYNVYNSYSSRPWITYHDPYGSLFWWWLLDRSLDDRAWWAYHHRYDMDPARYDALVAQDQQLQARVAQLEAQQVARDPNFVPTGLDRDLMYSDQYVTRAYSNRSTASGAVAFWLLGVPLALGSCGFFIWLIWFKRWQTST